MQSMKLMNYHIIAWKILGIWPPKHKPFWYKCYTIFVFAVPLFLFPLLMFINLFSVNDLKEGVETMLPLVTVALATTKASLLFANQKKLKDLFELLGEMDSTIKLESHRMVIVGAVQESRRVLAFICSIYYGGVSFAFVIAVYLREMMWPSWFPFRCGYYDNVVLYYAMVLFQYSSNMVHALIDSTVDMYGSTLLKLLGCHFDIIGMRLEHFNVDNINLSDPDCGKDYVEEMYKKNLHECIEYHKLCIR